MDPRFAAALSQPGTTNFNLGGSPNGNSADVQHLQDAAQVQFRSGAASKAMGASGTASQLAADDEEAKRKAAAQAAEIAANLKAKQDKIKAEYEASLTDPSNYVRAVSDDGGYNFFDPTGKPISVRDYSKATGKQIDKALDGSNNPNDTKFSSEYKDLIDYGRALHGDQAAIDKFKNDSKYAGFLETYKDKPYGQVVQDFKGAWDGYMQPNQLNNLETADATGRNVQGDSITPGSGNPIMDWLTSHQRTKGVNYR